MQPQETQRGGNTKLIAGSSKEESLDISRLSDSRQVCTSNKMEETAPPKIFDSKRRVAKLERAAMRGHGDDFLWRQMAEDVGERLAAVTRDFHDVLLVGHAARFKAQILCDRTCNIQKAVFSPYEAKADGSMMISDEQPLVADSSRDLIVAVGILDSLNDLPGMLIQIRRGLRPDGLFLASLFGAGTLSTLKSIMMEAEEQGVAPHIHPQIDLKTMSDLVVRTGFALPVADIDQLELRYSELDRLLSDIRDMGTGNVMAQQPRYFTKSAYARLLEEWNSRHDAAGKVTEIFSLLHISGWSPSADQPKPARRGSGKVSLADILSNRDN